MGWLSHKMTTSIKQEWLNEYQPNNNAELLDYSFKNFNKHCWSLWKNKEGLKFINLTLIDVHTVNGIKTIGFKDMDTTCHPYYYDCPVKFLKQIDHNKQGGYHMKWLIYWAMNQARKKGFKIEFNAQKLEEAFK